MKKLVRMMLTAGLIAAPFRLAAADPGPQGLIQIQAGVYNDEPSVDIWTDRDWYAIGDPVRVTVTVDRPGFVTVYNIDGAGIVRRLTDDPAGVWVTPGRPLVLPRDRGAVLVTTGPGGEEEVIAVASRLRMVNAGLPYFDDCNSRAQRCDDDRGLFVQGLNRRLVAARPVGVRSVARTTFYVEPICRSPYGVRISGGIYIDLGFAIPVGAAVYVDGTYWGVGPAALGRLGSGSHKITVRTREGRKFTRTVEVGPSSRYRVDVEPQRQKVSNPTRDESKPRGKSR
jgi:hypothetical protein